MTTSTNVIGNSALLVSPTSEPHIGTEKPTVKPSKQLNYYYRHKLDRLTYQKDYYNKHKPTILNNKKNHYYSNKVKRTQNNISLIRNIHLNSKTLLYKVCDENSRKLLMDAYFHGHGKPNNSKYSISINKVNTASRLWFHVIPQFGIVNDGSKVYFDSQVKYKDIITSRQLSLQTAHFLGLHAGDSFYWKERHAYTGKVETHCVCFDGSGLDISHPNDLPSLVECRIETNVKGMDLLILFAEKHSVNNYLQVFRGNKLLLTSEAQNAYRDYVKHF